MRRSLAAAVYAAGALLAPTGADAKAPLDGVDICGPSACVHLTMQQAEGEWALFSGLDQTVRPTRVAPFFALRWHWTGEPEQKGYLIPSAGETRQLDPHGVVTWQSLATAQSVRAMVSTLAPYPAPVLTRATVGGRAVRNPRSYAKLYGRGVDAFPIILPAWIPIRFAASSRSPWTDPGTDLRISRRGALLWEDGSIVKIPLRLAQRIRARQALR